MTPETPRAAHVSLPPTTGRNDTPAGRQVTLGPSSCIQKNTYQPLVRPLSVVMPAYNEEAGIAAAIHDVQRHVFAIVPDAELLVVDDGSRDATGLILDQLAAEDHRLRVIHQSNAGHGNALRTGLEAASGEYILLIDSDRQIPLSEFTAAWSRVQSNALRAVLGVRRDRKDPLVRLGLTIVVRHAIRLLFGVHVSDANAPFKLLHRDVWLEAREVIPPGALAPSLFLAIFLKWRGHAIEELEVEHRARETGRAIRSWKLFRLCARGFVQLAAFRRALR
jgi:glycosyltransferase involved in cell wall biosynthesis